MRASILLTVASLFLIGSHSLPQPEGLEVTRTIEKREANVPKGDPGALYSSGQEWCEQHPGRCHDTTTSNSTRVEERQVPGHFGPPDGMSWAEFKKYMKHMKGGNKASTTTTSDQSTTSDTSDTSDTSTTVGSDGGNSTKVRMVKFKD